MVDENTSEPDQPNGEVNNTVAVADQNEIAHGEVEPQQGESQ